MVTVPFDGVLAANQLSKRVLRVKQEPRPAMGPAFFYPGQDITPLYHHIPAFRQSLPPVPLQIGVVENATIMVTPGYDAVMLDGQSRVLLETCYFTDIWRQQQKQGAIEVAGPEVTLESLFLSFDSAWANYYHWTCFAIGPAAVATALLDPKIPIGLPDYADRIRFWAPSFSKAAYDEALALLPDPSRVMRLKQGVYRVARAYVMFVDGGETNQLTIHQSFLDAYRGMAARVAPGGGTRRIFISRLQQGANGRITAEEDAMFEHLSAQRGFEKVFLEGRSFVDQVRLFAESEAVLAPHGSGLVNTFYSRPGTRVIELNRDIDDRQGALRPWFYILAEGAGHRYALLNGDTGDFTVERVNACFDALGL